jgi:L-lactate permease
MTMKYCLVFFLVFTTAFAISQNTYQLKGGTEAPLLYGGAIGLGLSFPINKKIEPLNMDQVYEMDPNKVNAVDRVATKTYSAKARKVSDYFLRLSPIIPLSSLANNNSRDEFGVVSTMYLETSLVSFGITELTKVIAKRTRPFVYNSEVDNHKKLERDARKSFISGHTSHVAASTFFTAKALSDLNPDSKYNSLYWATAATIPALTAYLRVRGGKHFPTDVLVGYAVGALVGILVPELHK